jgi:hypothetical protein
MLPFTCSRALLTGRHVGFILQVEARSRHLLSVESDRKGRKAIARLLGTLSSTSSPQWYGSGCVYLCDLLAGRWNVCLVGLIDVNILIACFELLYSSSLPPRSEGLGEFGQHLLHELHSTVFYPQSVGAQLLLVGLTQSVGTAGRLFPWSLFL